MSIKVLVADVKFKDQHRTVVQYKYYDAEDRDLPIQNSI